MNVRYTALVLAAALLVGLMPAWGLAQSAGYYGYQHNYPVFPGGGGHGGWGGYGGYGNGGTAAGSYMHGMADVVRSAGYANVMNSVASQNYEQAYSMDLDNRLKATNTYFEMRRVNTAARAEERGPPPTAADVARYAEEMAPKRLTDSQLDPVTGEIKWPSVLQDNRFTQLRDKVEQLFNQRQSTSGGGASDYRKLNDAISALRAEMVKNIREFSSASYLEARKFLDSLEYETRFVAG